MVTNFKVPTFSGPTFTLRDEYESMPDIKQLYKVVHGLYALAFHARMKYVYAYKLFHASLDIDTPFLFEVLQSFYYSISMDVCRLYDTQGKDKSKDNKDKVKNITVTQIYSGYIEGHDIISTLKNRTAEASDDIEDTIKQYNEKAEEISKSSYGKKLKLLRNKMYAHNDASYCFDYSKLIEDCGLYVGDIKKLIDYAGTMCAIILGLLIKDDEMPFLTWSDDVFDKYTSDFNNFGKRDKP